jgi:hypothetical protein
MKKNIIVLCFGRSGSTNFLDSFVENEKLNYENAAEIFCRGKRFNIVPTKKKDFTFLKADFSQHHATFEEQYEIYQAWQKDKNKNLIMKMWIGWHLHYWKEEFYQEFYNNSHVIWLFRKDIIAQGISGRLTDPKYRSLEHIDKVKMDPFVLDFNYEKDIDWKVNQLEKFIDNITSIDNLIISEDIFNKDAAIETLRSMYGINFYKRPQNNPDYLKRQLIINYEDIQANIIKLGYVSRINVAINKLRWHAKRKEIIKNVVGKL